MTLRGHNKRLSILNAALPRKPDPEEEAALSRIISYLDSLAARKASGDMSVQQEIENVCAFMKGNTPSKKIKSKYWDYEKLAQKNFNFGSSKSP